VGFAMLALFVQGLAPPGFMLARSGDSAVIVLCTGHGPALSLADLTGHPAKAPKSKPDAPCAFAGHGLGAAPPLSARVAAPFDPISAPTRLARLDLTPGRGLAAPPPPSQGPPDRFL
jgi:hypothetical protein